MNKTTVKRILTITDAVNKTGAVLNIFENNNQNLEKLINEIAITAEKFNNTQLIVVNTIDTNNAIRSIIISMLFKNLIETNNEIVELKYYDNIATLLFGNGSVIFIVTTDTLVNKNDVEVFKSTNVHSSLIIGVDDELLWQQSERNDNKLIIELIIERVREIDCKRNESPMLKILI